MQISDLNDFEASVSVPRSGQANTNMTSSAAEEDRAIKGENMVEESTSYASLPYLEKQQEVSAAERAASTTEVETSEKEGDEDDEDDEDTLLAAMSNFQLNRKKAFSSEPNAGNENSGHMQGHSLREEVIVVDDEDSILDAMSSFQQTQKKTSASESSAQHGTSSNVVIDSSEETGRSIRAEV